MIQEGALIPSGWARFFVGVARWYTCGSQRISCRHVIGCDDKEAFAKTSVLLPLFTRPIAGDSD
jgi:hypothetical protein